MILLLGSDAGNNLSIVHHFASGEISLWSWQGLALGAALSAAPLGYATSAKRWIIIPCGVVCLMGGILTVLSTNTDFATQSAGAGKYQSESAALNAERSALLQSLSPSDGSLPCSKQRWCDSQAKEQRLAQINNMMSFADVQVDPLATPAGAFLSQIIAYLRAFGVPFVVAALGHIVGLMFHGIFRDQDSATSTGVRGKNSEKKLETSHTYKRETLRETTVEKAVERARTWLQEQGSGRISKTRLKVACRAKGHKAMARVVEILLAAGELVRYDNGQLGKPESKALRVVK
jgi:hypothetical protein